MENSPHTQPIDEAQAKPEIAPVEESESMPQRRPFGVTLLLLLVLSLSAWGLLRFAAAVRWWDVLIDKDARLSPLYLSITGAAWLATGIVLMWSLWSRKRWVYRAVPISVLVWLVEYWVERFFFQAPRPNLSFAVFASILSLLITFGIAFHRKTKTYLTKSEEHEQPEEHSNTA